MSGLSQYYLNSSAALCAYGCERLAEDILFFWTCCSISFHLCLSSKFNLTYIKRLTPSPFVVEGNQFKVIELSVCVSEYAVLQSFSLVFSLARSLLCELCAEAGASLRLCMFVLLWQQTVLLFPSGQVARQ